MTKTKKIAAIIITALVACTLAAFAGCSGGVPAKSQIKDNAVTVTLSGADGQSAFGDIKVEEGEALKLNSNVSGGNAVVSIKSSYTEIYTSRELSGQEEIGIAITAPGTLTIAVTGNAKASGTLTFEVVDEADIEGMDTGEATPEEEDADVEGGELSDEEGIVLDDGTEEATDDVAVFEGDSDTSENSTADEAAESEEDATENSAAENANTSASSE